MRQHGASEDQHQDQGLSPLLALLVRAGLLVPGPDQLPFRPGPIRDTTNRLTVLLQDTAGAAVRASAVYLHPCRSPARMDQEVQEGEQEELFIVTPTYSRQEQEAELTRLGQTLLLAGNVTWIVVEDRQEVSQRTKNILAKFSSLNIVLMAGCIDLVSI